MPYNCVSVGCNLSFEVTGKALYEIAQFITLGAVVNFKTQGSRVIIILDNFDDSNFIVFKKYYLELEKNSLNKLIIMDYQEVESDDDFEIYDDIPSKEAWDKLNVSKETVAQIEQSLRAKDEENKGTFSAKVEFLKADEKTITQAHVFISNSITAENFTIINKDVKSIKYEESSEESNEPEESPEEFEIDDNLSDKDIYLEDGSLGWRKK